jgi:hypothetical protein
MGAKVSFNTPEKLIQPTIVPDSDGVIAIDFQVDVYSDGKEDWASTDSELNRLRFPISALAGNIVATGKLGTTYILEEGWHMTPYDADHSYNLSGNVFTDDGSPLMQFDTDYAVAVQYVTTLTPPGLGLTPEQSVALESGSYFNEVQVKLGGTTNTAYPAGTSASPVGDIPSALTIAVKNGFTTIRVNGFFPLGSDVDLSGYKIVGSGAGAYLVMTDPLLTRANIQDCLVTGSVTGSDIRFQHGVVSAPGLTGYDGIFEDVTFLGNIGISSDAEYSYFINCHNGMTSSDHFHIDMNETAGGLKISSHEGGVGISNLANSDAVVTIDLVSGVVHIDSDVTAGDFIIRGVGQCVNEATSDISVDTTYLVDGTVKRSVINKQTLDSNGVLTVFDNDGVTVLLQQTVTDKDGGTITLDAGTPAKRTAN